MKKMDTAQLPPCPFCGDAAEVDEEIERVGQNRHRLTIKCTGCPCVMEVVFRHASHTDLVRMHRHTMTLRWNRRGGTE